MTTVRRAAVALLALLLVGGCSTSNGIRERERRAAAAQAAAAWGDPSVRERWDSAVVAEEPLLIPQTDPAAAAVLTRLGWGQLELGPSVDDQPGSGVVTNASGSTQAVATLGAASTLRAVRTRGSCGGALSCDDVVVTAAEPTTVTLPTGRGPASVPAWSFTVDGLDVPLVLPSLAEVTSPDDMAPGPAGGSTARVLGREDRTLRVGLLAGACVRDYRSHVLETDAVVVVWATARPAGGDCVSAEVERAETFTLRSPVGDRPVVSSSGALMLPATMP